MRLFKDLKSPYQVELPVPVKGNGIPRIENTYAWVLDDNFFVIRSNCRGGRRLSLMHMHTKRHIIGGLKWNDVISVWNGIKYETCWTHKTQRGVSCSTDQSLVMMLGVVGRERSYLTCYLRPIYLAKVS